jgi:hypothetical protein
MNDRILYVHNKCTKVIAILRRLRDIIDSKSLTQIYRSLFESILMYCSQIWCNAPKKCMDILVKVQKRCIRMMFFKSQRFHTLELLKKLKVYTVQNIVLMKRSTEMYKIAKNNKCDYKFEDIRGIHSHNTRRSSSCCFYTKPVRTNWGKCTFS